jgi:N-acetylglucosamine-6-phosphate deacetylase
MSAAIKHGKIMSLLLKNVVVVSPGVYQDHQDIVVENGIITRVGTGCDHADEVIDGDGLTAVPGFFDIHCHGADGADVCDNNLDAIRHIAAKKLAEGVTTWLPTTLTQPREILLEIVGKVAIYRQQQDLTRCPGLHVEGPFINKEKAGAQNPQFVRPPDAGELRALHEIVPVMILSLAPEMPGALELIREARSAGIFCSAAHTAATCAQIGTAIDAGLTNLTHFGNAMTPLHHREIGVVGAGLYDSRLMLEMICDTIHLCPDMLKLLFTVVPVERLMMITDSVAASWIGDGEIQLGGLVVEVRNHVARLKEGGALAGSTLRANEGLRNIVEHTGRTLESVIQVTSWNQARSLGMKGFGKIEPGYHADITLLRGDFSVARTIVGGETRFVG